MRTAGLLVNSPDSGVRPSGYRCWVALALPNWMILPEKVTEPLWVSIRASKPQKSKAEGLKSSLEDQDELVHVPQNKFLAHSRYSRCLAGVIEVLQVVVMIGAHTPSGPHSGLVLFKDCAYNSPITPCNNPLRLPWWLSGKESACQCRRCGFDP